MTLIDTSSWIEALRKDGKPKVKERVREIILSGDAALCEMVILELWNGARGDYEKKQLAEFIAEIPCIETTQRIWETAFDLAKRCRKQGKTVPATDLLVLSAAFSLGYSVEHNDEHFDLVLNLK
jgi:predicted nucleic acid-binding protein